MAITEITLTDAMVGTIVSPGPDQFIVKLVLVRAQQPAFQVECWSDLPYPFGTWRSGRFILRDRGGVGHRLINLSTQTGALVAGHVLMASGQQFAYSGDLILECIPRGQEWTLEISDVPVSVQQAA